MSELPKTEALALTLKGGRLDITFNRPDQRNAMNNQMNTEFRETLAWLKDNDDVRVVVLRGAGGHFSAGGDIKERRAAALEGDQGRDTIVSRNANSGTMFSDLENLPQTTIAMVEGSAFGGGFGFACTTDITIVTRSAKMGMPETTLGVAPAQISPFVVKRVGLTRARQLALTAERFNGERAYEIGVAQYFCEDEAADTTLNEIVGKVLNCGPNANAATKRIMLAVGTMPPDDLRLFSAEQFADLNMGAEGKEGQAAFAEKRKPAWQVRDDD